MKNTIFPIFFLLLFNTSNAQTWQWAKSPQSFPTDTGTSSGAPYSTATDHSGNVFMAGNVFCDSVTFGSYTLVNPAGHSFFTSNGLMFIAKYDSSGSVLWAKNATGPATVSAIITDSRGNIYVTGTYYDTVVFDGITLIDSGLEHAYQNIFLVKYNSGGSVVWAKTTRGYTGESNSTAITCDLYDNIYMTGYYGNVYVYFDTIKLLNHSAPSTGGPDVFLVKYDTSGNVKWAKNGGDNGIDVAASVTTDPTGNIYITGWFNSAIATFDTTTLTSSGTYFYLFLVKFDSNGNAIWAKSALGGNNDAYQKIAVTSDPAGDLYLSGFFSTPTIAFGSTTLSASPGNDLFLVKYDQTGSVIWAKNTPGVFNVILCADGDNNVYVTSDAFTPSLVLGTTKYSPTGGVLWRTTVGTIGHEGIAANAMASDHAGNIYVSGDFSAYSATFGATTLTNYDTSDSYPRNRIFLAKLRTAIDPYAGVTGVEQNTPVIYPNPTTGYISIQGAENVHVRIYDIAGRLIKEEINSNSVSIAEFPTGVYFIKLYDHQGQMIRWAKVIKQ